MIEGTINAAQGQHICPQQRDLMHIRAVLLHHLFWKLVIVKHGLISVDHHEFQQLLLHQLTCACCFLIPPICHGLICNLTTVAQQHVQPSAPRLPNVNWARFVVFAFCGSSLLIPGPDPELIPAVQFLPEARPSGSSAAQSGPLALHLNMSFDILNCVPFSFCHPAS